MLACEGSDRHCRMPDVRPTRYSPISACPQNDQLKACGYSLWVLKIHEKRLILEHAYCMCYSVEFPTYCLLRCSPRSNCLPLPPPSLSNLHFSNICSCSRHALQERLRHTCIFQVYEGHWQVLSEASNGTSFHLPTFCPGWRAKRLPRCASERVITLECAKLYNVLTVSKGF